MLQHKKLHKKKYSWDTNHIVTMHEDRTTLKRQTKKERATANGSNSLHVTNASFLKEKIMEKEEREKLVIWRRPLLTTHYFILETANVSYDYMIK